MSNDIRRESHAAVVPDDVERARTAALYAFEDEMRSRGLVAVAGVDEVGRGALAGPLCAGACVLPAHPRIYGLNDSKALTARKRERLAQEIRACATACFVGHAQPSEIDQLGLTAALRLAMLRALEGLGVEYDHVALDGLPLGLVDCETAIVKGDGRIASIAAASIIAKVERDALMMEMDSVHPGYGFAGNKGYGSPQHIAAIGRIGPCPTHRRSFAQAGGTGTLF